MYVTDTPVIDRLTDPVLRQVEELELWASELDQSLYEGEDATYPAQQCADLIAEGVELLRSTYQSA